MKDELVQKEESVIVRCPKCFKNEFKAIYEDNYCECGTCIRLVCINPKCCGEQDMKLSGEAPEWQKFLKKQQNLGKDYCFKCGEFSNGKYSTPSKLFKCTSCLKLDNERLENGELLF